jgi:hypothetical protein
MKIIFIISKLLIMCININYFHLAFFPDLNLYSNKNCLFCQYGEDSIVLLSMHN